MKNLTKKKQKGNWREPKSANNANITVSPPVSAPSEISQVITALKELTTVYKSNVSKHKRLLIDSGCNTNIIASTLHSDTPIIYRDSKEGIATAMDHYLILKLIMYQPSWIVY